MNITRQQKLFLARVQMHMLRNPDKSMEDAMRDVLARDRELHAIATEDSERGTELRRTMAADIYHAIRRKSEMNKVYNHDDKIVEDAQYEPCPRCAQNEPQPAGVPEEVCPVCKGNGMVWRSESGWCRRFGEPIDQSRSL